ncbi:hypothetical protein BLA29_009538, partial [Euroglyphus maynei]
MSSEEDNNTIGSIESSITNDEITSINNNNNNNEKSSSNNNHNDNSNRISIQIQTSSPYSNGSNSSLIDTPTSSSNPPLISSKGT